MNEQRRIEVQVATQEWVATFMNQYHIPASMMEDALNKVLVQLKDQIMLDMLIENNQQEPLTESSTNLDEVPQEEE